MAERLGLAILTGTGWRARDIETIAREAENAGFEAIFNVEANNDGLATAQLMGAVTSRIKVGTWVASIYLRHPYLCAQGAALIADATGGRMVLGLGVSHQPVNTTLGVDMGSPLAALRHYVTEVQSWLRGEGPATHLPQRPAPCPVPVYVAALTSKAVELAGEVADGVMPVFWPASRVAQSKRWIARGRARAPRCSKLEITLGLPTFVGDDIAATRAVARRRWRGRRARSGARSAPLAQQGNRGAAGRACADTTSTSRAARPDSPHPRLPPRAGRWCHPASRLPCIRTTRATALGLAMPPSILARAGDRVTKGYTR
jgi:alkanesulfonate monooxygenase SsuD/methylene tetrahydromethanopterin reductase-like flavin-dependent oxidoreductase (luciferase family)